MSKENPMICDNHLSIDLLASKILKLTNDPEIIAIATDIQCCAKDAMKQGTKMEKRLKKYYNSILKLGFERKGI
jgi:hypothetical protein